MNSKLGRILNLTSRAVQLCVLTPFAFLYFGIGCAYELIDEHVFGTEYKD